MTRWDLSEVLMQQPDWSIAAADVPAAPADFGLQLYAMQQGVSRGVDVLQIHNGRFQFSVLPTRGMGLWKGELGDFKVGWQSPVRQPVHPVWVPLHEPSGLGWLEGFNEWICRCGMNTNGAPDFDPRGRLAAPLHGRVANLPAHGLTVDVTDDQISVRAVVDECRVHFQKLRLTTTLTTRFNQPGLSIQDEVHNLSASEAEMQMLYHCNFGTPWLEAGCELDVAAEQVVPRDEWAAQGIGHWSTYAEPTPGMPERVYFLKLFADKRDETRVVLRHTGGQQAVSLRWNTKQLPCFTLWKNEIATEDGYVTGLEPATNYPNPHGFEQQQGRVVKLGAGQRHAMQVDVELHDTAGSVQEATQAVRAIANDRSAEVFEKPQANWCAP